MSLLDGNLCSEEDYCAMLEKSHDERLKTVDEIQGRGRTRPAPGQPDFIEGGVDEFTDKESSTLR